MIYNGTPVKSLNVHHFEMNTNDCDMVASDLQAGKTAVARGQKITGTGKCFSFASYGTLRTNYSEIIPTYVNTVFISGVDYPVRMTALMIDIIHYDFSTAREIAEVIIDGVTYPISVCAKDGELLISCEKNIDIELFFGKDEYI